MNMSEAYNKAEVIAVIPSPTIIQLYTLYNEFIIQFLCVKK